MKLFCLGFGSLQIHAPGSRVSWFSTLSEGALDQVRRDRVSFPLVVWVDYYCNGLQGFLVFHTIGGGSGSGQNGPGLHFPQGGGDPLFQRLVWIRLEGERIEIYLEGGGRLGDILAQHWSHFHFCISNVKTSDSKIQIRDGISDQGRGGDSCTLNTGFPCLLLFYNPYMLQKNNQNR